ncbi:hypothetical protein [[Muricauda] lutisoli]|uniref:Uncharacterized protein n=1 Tax=[Muricauda] lutisoli TaxID=2816035 RepID=A0ABS3EUF0_9FLAO|nr:hypothetical protein [[Muricauda] lutisoli]MBO0329880.1 hypothetical protein [[Muricauda] lutisoli]
METFYFGRLNYNRITDGDVDKNALLFDLLNFGNKFRPKKTDYQYGIFSLQVIEVQTMKLLKRYILSYDTIIALFLTIACLFFLQSWVDGNLIKDLLSMGIGVLSIIFSIFFAALAFIIGASDDEFVSFLEETGLFTALIGSFRWTVGSLFIALLYSIFTYILITFKLSENKCFVFSEWIVVIFCFLFFYSLIATMISTNDAIRYSKRRIKFVNLKKVDKKVQEE